MGWIKRHAGSMLGCMDRTNACLSNIEQALVMIMEELKFINGTHPRLLAAKAEKKYELDTPEKRVAVRNTKKRWTDEEAGFVSECIRAGLSHSTIQRGLRDLGYDRTLSSVKHWVNDYKRAIKPIK